MATVNHIIVRVTGLLRYLHTACGQVLDTSTDRKLGQVAKLHEATAKDRQCKKCEAKMTDKMRAAMAKRGLQGH